MLGIVGALAIISQLMTSINAGRDIVNFFSFFTIESNILGVGLLILLGIGGLLDRQIDRFAYPRGAITLYMIMVGVIYILLLSGNEVALQTTIPWVNIVLHYLLPAFFALDWLLFPPVRAIMLKKALIWLLFPLAYLCYSLIRGSFVNWYPYPFLDPRLNGWGSLIITSLIITAGSLFCLWLLILRTSRSSK